MSIYSIIDRKVIIPLGDKIKGRNLHGEFADALKTQWLSEEGLARLQNDKLQRLLKHAYLNVPYYTRVFNELGLMPQDIKSRADLAKLPILTKEIIKEYHDELISKDIDNRQAIDGSTGGSTGTPMRFKEDMNTWNKLRGLNFRGGHGQDSMSEKSCLRLLEILWFRKIRTVKKCWLRTFMIRS